MSYNPGRNIGRVSIRVLPDTKNFNRDLRRQLDEFANRNKLDLSATIANRDEFRREVQRLINDASRDRVRIQANAVTAAAAAQLRYTARDRVVQFFARVNEGALLKTATALAALSGARLAGSWAEDILDFARNLDKTLPSILNWTTGITSTVAALAAATSGLVGIGSGLFSIAPALLVVPGLAINAIGSITALIVAWRNAGTELGSLGDGMRELGDIINTTYWDRARQPILDLVNGLMPQLRNSFRDLSAGVGDFTGALAAAFGGELANGRLESIFKGIADGWRVLGTGAGGFAGAIVSLSQIAATYTPRLAAWFVRQANTFDAFLKSIATDGRLAAWMETAIDSMHDLWDATTGTAGVLEGLWRAADTAGSGGLAGFADMMQAWERTVKGADFQRGMTAVFRGSYVAMEAFGRGIRAVGQLVADLDGAFEGFIGSSGRFLGGMLEGIANALNSSAVATGLQGLSDGLDATLRGILPSLQPIADTFGRFLGLLGELASTLLPTAAGVLAELMPTIDALIGAIKPVLEPLGQAVSDIAGRLGPAVEDFVTAASPAFQAVVKGLADALVDLAPAVADLVEGFATVIDGLNAWTDANRPFFENLAVSVAPDGQKWRVQLEQAMGDRLKGSAGYVLPMFDAEAQGAAEAYADAIIRVYRDRLASGGPEAGTAFLDGLRSVDIPAGVMEQLELSFGPDLEGEFNARGRSGGGGFSRGLAQGIIDSTPLATSAASGIKIGVQAATADAGSWLTGQGGQAVGGFKSGAEGGVPAANGVFAGLRATVQGTFPNAWGMLSGAGSAIMSGLLSGLRSAWEGVKSFVSGIAPWIAANKGPEAYDRQLLVKPGEWIMGGLERGLSAGFGRVKSRVSTMADEIRGEFGAGLGTGISAGLDKSLSVARSTRLPIGASTAPGEYSGLARTVVNVTQPLLPGETPKEQRDNLVKELQWAF